MSSSEQEEDTPSSESEDTTGRPCIVGSNTCNKQFKRPCLLRRHNALFHGTVKARSTPALLAGLWIIADVIVGGMVRGYVAKEKANFERTFRVLRCESPICEGEVSDGHRHPSGHTNTHNLARCIACDPRPTVSLIFSNCKGHQKARSTRSREAHNVVLTIEEMEKRLLDAELCWCCNRSMLLYFQSEIGGSHDCALRRERQYRVLSMQRSAQEPSWFDIFSRVLEPTAFHALA